MNEAVYNPFVSSHSSDAQLPPDDGEEEGYRQIRATVKTLDPFSWWGC
ncbi:hypothetical protein V6N11_080647 [Hibiscus sabdariffa]|uniref:Uncharacterized protein n=1 Tax=Hibiscus sabdariffa TaxID=183260 RepID=A0ABR2QI30_9ROSI